MIKTLLTFLLFSISFISYSNEIKEIPERDFFKLEGNITLKGNIPHLSYLESRLDSLGCNISPKFMGRLFANKIIFERHLGLSNLLDRAALKIDINYNKIVVQYSSFNASIRALELILSRFERDSLTGVFIIPIQTIIELSPDNSSDFSDDFNPNLVASLESKQTLFDLSDKTLQYSFLERAIEYTSKYDTLELWGVTNYSWGLESELMDSDGVNWPQLISVTHYDKSQLKTLNNYANEQEIVLTLNLSLGGNNPIFHAATGHSENSAEGMRFVRALLKEWRDDTGINHFVIYGLSKQELLYKQFFDRIESLLNVTIEVRE